mmetsp:Transcript_59498/g.66583  ORF Transcript_59498/g.66583 Transcript_59498/m.66583 type:complete len:228 (+) Transcript_59498:172-855(+)
MSLPNCRRAGWESNFESVYGIPQYNVLSTINCAPSSNKFCFNKISTYCRYSDLLASINTISNFLSLLQKVDDDDKVGIVSNAGPVTISNRSIMLLLLLLLSSSAEDNMQSVTHVFKYGSISSDTIVVDDEDPSNIAAAPYPTNIPTSKICLGCFIVVSALMNCPSNGSVDISSPYANMVCLVSHKSFQSVFIIFVRMDFIIGPSISDISIQYDSIPLLIVDASNNNP